MALFKREISSLRRSHMHKLDPKINYGKRDAPASSQASAALEVASPLRRLVKDEAKPVMREAETPPKEWAPTLRHTSTPCNTSSRSKVGTCEHVRLKQKRAASIREEIHLKNNSVMPQLTTVDGYAKTAIDWEPFLRCSLVPAEAKHRHSEALQSFSHSLNTDSDDILQSKLKLCLSKVIDKQYAFQSPRGVREKSGLLHDRLTLCLPAQRVSEVDDMLAPRGARVFDLRDASLEASESRCDESTSGCPSAHTHGDDGRQNLPPASFKKVSALHAQQQPQETPTWPLVLTQRHKRAVDMGNDELACHLDRVLRSTSRSCETFGLEEDIWSLDWTKAMDSSADHCVAHLVDINFNDSELSEVDKVDQVYDADWCDLVQYPRQAVDSSSANSSALVNDLPGQTFRSSDVDYIPNAEHLMVTGGLLED